MNLEFDIEIPTTGYDSVLAVGQFNSPVPVLFADFCLQNPMFKVGQAWEGSPTLDCITFGQGEPTLKLYNTTTSTAGLVGGRPKTRPRPGKDRPL